MQSQRYRADRAHIAGNDFACPAVTAGHAFAEQTILVNQRHAESVDLELGDIVHIFRACKLPHAPLPFAQLVFRIRILQTHHRYGKCVRRKFLRGLATDAL